MGKRHKLKILEKYYNDILNGTKTFEIRKNDRNFQVGDVLSLHVWDPEENEFKSGIKADVRIVYITDFEQKEGYVVLGIDLLNAEESFEELGDTVLYRGPGEIKIFLDDKLIPLDDFKWTADPDDSGGLYEFITLNEIKQYLESYRLNEEVIYVWYETPLTGFIYQYGNYGEYWTKHGETRGFA
ncbi:hypothetical protein CHH53_10390 [Terribacillus sp. 7520-G]|nr:hypothetical protein CHH53_10390 [Terribacillus sp. 7520-G]